MISKPVSGVSTMVFIHKEFDEVIQKLGIYTELAKKFINKHKRYQYMKHVEKLPNDQWCLIFKILPANHESVKEYNRMINQCKKDAWINYLNSQITG
jgi:hypothetical protein